MFLYSETRIVFALFGSFLNTVCRTLPSAKMSHVTYCFCMVRGDSICNDSAFIFSPTNAVEICAVYEWYINLDLIFIFSSS